MKTLKLNGMSRNLNLGESISKIQQVKSVQRFIERFKWLFEKKNPILMMYENRRAGKCLCPQVTAA
jgi:hypothetical protein